MLDRKQVTLLIQWYHQNKRDLPWRTSPHPYWVWLAEVMSQQTQISTLLPYFYKFIKALPNVKALSRARDDKVMGLWAGLGYYSRARNLHQAAKQIVRMEHFPGSVKEWMRLPGVGHYTAAAIASQVSGVHEPVFDGNVRRVMARLHAIKNAHTLAFKERSLNELRLLIRDADASAFNQAMMELGAMVCVKQNPECGVCPLQKGCKGRNRPGLYPQKKKMKKEVAVHVRSFIFERDGKVLFVKRMTGDWFAALWDLPGELGGVKEPVRKMKLPVCQNNHNGARLAAQKIGSVKHSITHHKIKIDVYLIEENTGLIAPKHSKWIHVEDLASFPISTTAKKALHLYFKRGTL